MKRTNFFTILLMTTSMLLLLVLQFFWIRSAYTEALVNLTKEINSTFRTTIFTMRDSLTQQMFESISTDSAMHMIVRRRSLMDSLRSDEGFQEGEHDRGGRRNTQPGIIIQGLRFPGSDTVQHRRQGKFFEFHDRRDFMFRFAPDSLHTDSIEVNFKSALAKAGIDLPFRIVHPRRGEHRVLLPNSFLTESVRINPFSRYAAVISGFRAKIVSAILPQALFSVFLTLLTMASFLIMYRSIRAQQKLVQLKNDFISNITHELKTPITTVSVAIEALRNFKGLNNPALTDEYLGIAQNELSRLSILTDKVLKTAIYEDKGIAFRLERVDIEKMILQVTGSLRLILEKSGATLTFDKDGTDFTVSGDQDHMINVIYNLLDNAIKYSPAPAILSITLKELSDTIVLSIGDNGPGIAPEYRKKIFEKFFRVPTGDVHNIKGYGLGLSYVESVVKSHLGTIEVKPNGAQGSCFVITLPKQKP